MSAYTDAAIALFAAYHYDLDETTGVFANRNTSVTGVDLTAVGTVQRATRSILPGDAAQFSLSQDKDAPMASRANNVSRDVALTRLTLAAWVRPVKIKTVSQPLVQKGSQYAVNLVDSRVSLLFNGVTYNTPSDLIVADQTFLVVATYNDSPAEVRCFINGVEQFRQAITHSTLAANTTVFQVGGQDFFGTAGISGSLQHVGIYQNIALTEGQVRSLYEIGMSSTAEIAGQGANAFAWSRQILSPSSRDTLRVTNESDVTVYLALAAEATVGGGYPLAPGQSTGHDLDGYTGPLSCIHGNPGGAKRLALVVR